MRAGDLKNEIEIEQRIAGQDEFGQRYDIWRPFIKLRAAIDTLAVREFIAAQGIAAGATHKITVRYVPQLEKTAAVAAMRVRFRGRVFNLKGAANIDERNREIWMLAEEGLNEG